MVIGSPACLPPEQARGGLVAPLANICGLGAKYRLPPA